MNIPDNIAALITDLQERKVNGSVTLHLDAGDVRTAIGARRGAADDGGQAPRGHRAPRGGSNGAVRG